MEKKKLYFQVIIPYEIEAESVKRAKSDITLRLNQYGLQNFTLKQVRKNRSLSQNNALHGWLSEIADQCIEKGLTLEVLYEEPNDIPVTMEQLKEFAKATSEHLFQESKTSKLNTAQFSHLIETLDFVFTNRLDNQIPFWSVEYQMNAERFDSR